MYRIVMIDAEDGDEFSWFDLPTVPQLGTFIGAPDVSGIFRIDAVQMIMPVSSYRPPEGRAARLRRMLLRTAPPVAAPTVFLVVREVCPHHTAFAGVPGYAAAADDDDGHDHGHDGYHGLN